MPYGFKANKMKVNVPGFPRFDDNTALTDSTTYSMSASHTYYDHTFNNDCWAYISMSGSSGLKILNVLAFYTSSSTQQIAQLETNETARTLGFIPIKAGTKIRITNDGSNQQTFNVTINEWT